MKQLLNPMTDLELGEADLGRSVLVYASTSEGDYEWEYFIATVSYAKGSDGAREYGLSWSINRGWTGDTVFATKRQGLDRWYSGNPFARTESRYKTYINPGWAVVAGYQMLPTHDEWEEHGDGYNG